MLATCGYQVVEIWQFLGESKIQNLICQYLKSKYRLPRECSPGSAHKESTCNMGDLGSIPGLGRSPGGGKGYPLQYSGLENPMGYIDHGILQARILEWVAFPSSRGSSQPRDRTQVSHVAGGFFMS